MRFLTQFVAICFLSIASVTPGLAQAPTGNIKLELNRLEPMQDGGCRLSIVAQNGLERPINNLGLEVVFFDADGLIEQFLRLQFSRISAGKTRVLFFDLAGKSCDSLSRLHINDVTNCVPASITDVYCPDLLALENRTAIQFGD
ncbi:hypothetical protein [Roseibium sp.]|uniref:hypothetical protein n=1 Tax=Roseibium sp. TaxID=1936156 RepID=UPI003BA94FF4